VGRSSATPPQWSTAVALGGAAAVHSLRGRGGGLLNRRQGGEARLRASDARVPRLLSRRDRAGLGRRAGAGRGRGRTSGRDAGGRATSMGTTCGGDEPQCTLERASSGPRGPRRRGWRRSAARRARGRARHLAVATSRCNDC
jgi:hypothetical protein